MEAFNNHGEEILKLIDEEFYKTFLNELFKESCTPEESDALISSEWLEQRLFTL
jgi:hypothetical protein